MISSQLFQNSQLQSQQRHLQQQSESQQHSQQQPHPQPQTSSPYRIVIIYGEKRRGLVVDPKMPQDLKPLVQGMFDIHEPFQALSKSDSAEILSTKDTLQGDEIHILLNQRK